jgi:hypothetical protein
MGLNGNDVLERGEVIFRWLSKNEEVWKESKEGKRLEKYNGRTTPFRPILQLTTMSNTNVRSEQRV